MNDTAAAIIIVRVYLCPDGPAVRALKELGRTSALTFKRIKDICA